MSELQLLPIRIIPFDIGNEIDSRKFDKITSIIEKKSDWIVEQKTRNSKNELFRFSVKGTELYSISVSVYQDGIGIISIREKAILYENVNDFKHFEIISKRKEFHKGVLTHNHQLTPVINDVIECLRILFTKNTRHTSLCSWENNGLSYVMSFFFITGNPDLINDTSFQDKILALLFPHDYDQQIQYDIETLGKSSESIEKKFRDNYCNVIKSDFETLPHIFAYASWSNFLVFGNISEKNIANYWEIEKDLQHIWFYTYITDKFIEHSLSKLDAKIPEQRLEKLFNILTEMLYKINKYEGVISSTLHERDFKLFEVLMKSSRLDLLISSVEKRAGLLKDRYTWIIEEKRIHSDKKVELILFVIAILSLISSFETFKKFGTTNSIILILSIFFIALLLFKSYIFHFKKK